MRAEAGTLARQQTLRLEQGGCLFTAGSRSGIRRRPACEPWATRGRRLARKCASRPFRLRRNTFGRGLTVAPPALLPTQGMPPLFNLASANCRQKTCIASRLLLTGALRPVLSRLAMARGAARSSRFAGSCGNFSGFVLTPGHSGLCSCNRRRESPPKGRIRSRSERRASATTPRIRPGSAGA